MYKCEFCGSLSEPCARVHRVVTEYRKKVYETKERDIFGYEIAKEAIACGACAVVRAASPPVAEAPEEKAPAKPAGEWTDSLPDAFVEA